MKTIKFTISALCLFLVSLTYGQIVDDCSDFNNGFNGWQNIGTITTIANSNSLDGSSYLRIQDQGGYSLTYNSISYSHNWDSLVGHCLCFDYKVYSDGNSGVINVIPSLAIYNNTTPMNSNIIVGFQAYTTVTENDEWVHVCAPIEFSDGISLPSNADGFWTYPGVSAQDWDALLLNVGGIAIGPDIGGPGAEIVGFDNICIEDCGALIDSNPFGAYCCGTGDDNLVINGNFEDAINLDFTSDYTNDPSVYPGNFSVGNTALALSAFNTSITDHSNCASSTQYPLNDQFLLVNGRTQQPGISTAVIWEHVLTGLDTSSTYKFCANFVSMPQCTFDISPKVSFEVDGVAIGGVTTLLAPLNACDWILISENFSTGQNTSVTLQIILDQAGNGDGNDLAIDDISVTKLIDPELSITVQHQGSPDHIIASVNTIDVLDDGLHCADTLYEWRVAEVLSYAPGNIVILPPWTIGNASVWGLTTTFPGYSFDPDKMYMIVLHTDTCGCYDEGYTFQLTYNFRPMALQMTPEQELSIIESIRNGTIGHGETANAIQELNDGSDGLILYPNPVKNSFTISLKDNSLKSVEVLSLTGQTLLSKKYSDAKAEEILDISQLASGIYLVKAYAADNTQYITKVVKE
ncbi:T9SS type A sorting domain-containing protein [Cryomorpha ignava]|uniref:T9SS type A sorting domain-containing protein n=1 Tax=Cryomorpha ignava TaxID=101383 RepID=A0A7K3WKY3_9FLAO|nr:T9SS type A sorting domain-containing protein [Cryomorpha ignava]NEN22154.1 T9SS type A sorting domain-containing protein [Cryomorpha ignava]